jgi:hypothetical protein
VKASVRKRIRALEIVVSARIAVAEERSREDELFANKLANMTPDDRAEMESIYACFENTAKQLALCEPLDHEGEWLSSGIHQPRFVTVTERYWINIRIRTRDTFSA